MMHGQKQNDPYKGTIIVHANVDLMHDSFYMRKGASILLSPDMRIKLRQMKAGNEYTILPVEDWEREGNVTISQTDIQPITVMSPSRSPFIDFILQNMPQKELVGAEIGVLYGYNALNMLKSLPLKTLYLIDPYTSNEEYVARYHTNFRILSEAEEYAHDALKPFHHKIIWLRQKSNLATETLQDNSLDFAYCDGDKTYHNFREELELLIPKIKPSGVLGGHDYINAYQVNEIKTVVDEFTMSKGLQLFYTPEQLQWWWFPVNERS